MNVLVIGGTRFMGRHLVNELINQGQKVTIATRGVTKDDFLNKVDRLIIDRFNEKSIKDNLSNKFFDIVFDSLAYCSNDVKILLDHINCKRYVMISTTAVYKKHINTKEEEFDPLTNPLIWCERNEFPYEEVKRQAESALFQEYPDIESAAVRFPFVIGNDDYTKRLSFYIDHIVNQKPMFVDNFDKQMAFVRSDEAGKFLASFTVNGFSGAVNGASEGTISIKDIAAYLEKKTKKAPVLTWEGEKAPYNGVPEYSINIDKAKALGYKFSPLKTWIHELIDEYI